MVFGLIRRGKQRLTISLPSPSRPAPPRTLPFSHRVYTTMYPSPILTHEFTQPLQTQIHMQREMTTQLATFSHQLTKLIELVATSPGEIDTDMEKGLWKGLRKIKMKVKELEDGLQSLKKQRALDKVFKEAVRYCTQGLQDLGKAVEREGERLREFLEGLRAAKGI